MKKTVLTVLCALFLLLTEIGVAGEALLMGADELVAEIGQAREYQLLDARNAKAQRDAPIAFSTQYRKTTPVRNGLVLIVADTDAAALEIAQSISHVPGRKVLAVQGGAETWQRVLAQTAPASGMPESFVIPMNTCEQGKPLQELKRNKPTPEEGK